MSADAIRKLSSTVAVLSNLPGLAGTNGSILLIDDAEAAKCAADISAGIAEIERLRLELKGAELGLKMRPCPDAALKEQR